MQGDTGRSSRGMFSPTQPMNSPVSLISVAHPPTDARFHRLPNSAEELISEGLRRDEVQFDQHTARKLAEALKRRGVAERVLQEAMAEIAGDS
jgi:hypothetical protein